LILRKPDCHHNRRVLEREQDRVSRL